MAELKPKTDTAKLSERIARYIDLTKLSVGSLSEDAASIPVPYDPLFPIELRPRPTVTTVTHDLADVLGMRGDRFNGDELEDTAYALGLIVGEAMRIAGVTLPPEYQEVAERIAHQSLRSTVERRDIHG